MVLKIGPIAVEPPVVLAPMAGVTNPAFRSLCRSYGPGLYVTEMVSSRALVEGNLKTRTMMQREGDAPVHSVQLSGVDPNVVGAAVRIAVDDFGADHVDLNMGCPVPKVTRLGGGAALPVHRVLLRDIVRAAVRAAGAVPLTVKMRKGIDDATLTYLDAGRIVEGEGGAAVALHARTAEQLYSGRADWTAIAELKQAVTSIPVLGNGDVWAAPDAVRMMRETGCDGVVVGRGCLGRPWLFGDLANAFNGNEVAAPPTLGVVIAVMQRHARLLAEFKGDEFLGVRDFRKHVGWYLTGYAAGSERRRRLGQASSFAELDDLLGELDPTVTLPPESEHLPRGHLHGPRPVTLPAGWRECAEDPTPPEGADVESSGG
ncbi:MAG TPA: tRNA dihydrouridine synthase DusB [Mycobacteriales bacterium]|nr:tRNA dihydrouridine synthase DusB [Mycobacteriales bacterium]